MQKTKDSYNLGIIKYKKIDYPSFGFSLMEMVIVLVILSILASIGLPRYNKAVERSRISGAVSILDTIRTAQFHYATEYSVYSGNLSNVGPMIPTGDKYFNFSINGSGFPFDTNNDVVGYAQRNSAQAGTYSSGYLIYITENGTMSSSDANVNNVLQ